MPEQIVDDTCNMFNYYMQKIHINRMYRKYDGLLLQKRILLIEMNINLCPKSNLFGRFVLPA